MGGQACVFYGAAEFSRDIDFVVVADTDNILRLHAALRELQAEPVAVPGLDADVLSRGHAVHFPCRAPEVSNLRVDVMAVLRGVASFEELWARRTTLLLEDDEVDLLSLEDLVLAKKTQCDKDWPMIRRLVERSYFSSGEAPEPARISFWLRELRTPELLQAVALEYPEMARDVAETRPAASAALRGDLAELERLLQVEEEEEGFRDRQYWEPLKREIEQMRRAKRNPGALRT